MLQRAKFWDIEREVKKKDISVYDLCREANRFVMFLNSIEFTDDFIEKINFVRKAESSLNTIINIFFSEMNPDLNPIIREEDRISGNYNSLLLYLQKLKTSIGEARQNLTLSLKSKTDIETNALVNNSNISFFISQLSSIFKDLIFHSLARACQIVVIIENPAVYFEDEKGKKYVLKIPINERKALFDYLTYAYFLRTLQSTVPIFSSLRPSESMIKILPPEAREYQKMIAPKQFQQPPQNPIQKQEEGGEDVGDTEEPESI